VNAITHTSSREAIPIRVNRKYFDDLDVKLEKPTTNLKARSGTYLGLYLSNIHISKSEIHLLTVHLSFSLGTGNLFVLHLATHF